MRLKTLKLRLQSLWYDCREVSLAFCLVCCVFAFLFFLVKAADDFSAKRWTKQCRSLGAVPHIIEGNHFCITKEKPE